MKAQVLPFPVVKCALQNPMSALSTSALPSERRLAANRANAQRSTGPLTPEGKAKSSLNAVKTGLTGRTVLLPSEDAEAYETHLIRYLEEFQPVGVRETQLVQNLADTQWRLDRIPSLETGLFALGRMRYAELFEDRHLLDAHILMVEARHFKNLHLQESRLRRQYRQDAQELREHQAKRRQEAQDTEERTRLGKKTAVNATASPATLKATGSTPAHHHPENGFEFTNTVERERTAEKSQGAVI